MMMETEFTEEEVVENPTLKAAYNLPPLHHNQVLRWDYEVSIIGKKVFDKALHLCEVCELPTLVYGRLLPCKHIFCFNCARKCEPLCKRCSATVQKVEELALGTVYVCTYGAPKHSTKGCRRTYLSQRDLQSHFAHRHMSKKSTNETKTSQPQPLTQQQAAALQHVSQTVAPHSQSGQLSTNSQQSQQVTLSAPVIPALGLTSPHESGQLVTPLIPDLADIRTGSASQSPIVSQASPDPKSNLMPHRMGFNPSPQTNDQGIYRPIDVQSLPHQLQQHQQQQHQLQHQHHQLQPPKQQPPQMVQLSGSPGMPPMSKPMLRYNQPMQNPMSSSLLPPHVNPYQVTTSNSPIEMHMSTQMHHQPQQNVNLQQQQQQLPGMMHPRMQPMQKNMDQMQTDMDMGNFNNMPKMDSFGNMQKLDNMGGMQNMDNFNNMSQRKPFNNLQEMDNFSPMQKMDSYNSPQSRDDFNNMQGGLMDSSKASPNPQGGLSRNKNVNLITVPIQDEGQYRPSPFVGQSQIPPGAANNSNIPFSTNMSAPNNPSSNFSSLVNSQTMGGNFGGMNPARMQFNRPGNPQTRLAQHGNLQTRLPQPGNTSAGMSNPGPMMNQQRAGAGGMGMGTNLAMAGMVQALARAKGGNPGGPGAMQGSIMPNPGSLVSSHNPRFNTPPTGSHWPGSSNLRTIQPRMTQNTPRPKGDGHFKQNYFG